MTNDLYAKLICALTHDKEVCGACQKCGKDCAEARMNIIKQLAEETGMGVPWGETNDVR